MDDIYKNIEELQKNSKRKILIVFDDMIADMLSDKKLNTIVTELFIIGRKLNIPLAFLQNLIRPNSRPNSSHYFIMKIPNK